MKAIQCELCGSNDLVKQNGVYVCQYCGTQYTIEEAKICYALQKAVSMSAGQQ